MPGVAARRVGAGFLRCLSEPLVSCLSPVNSEAVSLSVSISKSDQLLYQDVLPVLPIPFL